MRSFILTGLDITPGVKDGGFVFDVVEEGGYALVSGSDHSGELRTVTQLPETMRYNGKEYLVIGFAENAFNHGEQVSDGTLWDVPKNYVFAGSWLYDNPRDKQIALRLQPGRPMIVGIQHNNIYVNHCECGTDFAGKLIRDSECWNVNEELIRVFSDEIVDSVYAPNIFQLLEGEFKVQMAAMLCDAADGRALIVGNTVYKDFNNQWGLLKGMSPENCRVQNKRHVIVECVMRNDGDSSTLEMLDVVASRVEDLNVF